MTDMHDDYLDHATTRLRAAVTAAGDEHDLWVAEVSKRARRYQQVVAAILKQDDREHWWAVWAYSRRLRRLQDGRQYLAKAEAMEALLRWAES